MKKTLKLFVFLLCVIFLPSCEDNVYGVWTEHNDLCGVVIYKYNGETYDVNGLCTYYYVIKVKADNGKIYEVYTDGSTYQSYKVDDDIYLNKIVD